MDGSLNFLIGISAFLALSGMFTGIILGGRRRSRLALHRMGKELSDSKKQIRDLFENIDAAIWSVETGTHDLNVSAGVEKVYGYSMEDFRRNPELWFDVVYPDDIGIVELNTKKLNSGEPANYEHRMIMKSGAVRWVQCIATPVKSFENKVIRLNGVMIDITEKKAVQDELAASRAQLQNILNTVDVAIWSYDAGLQKIQFTSGAFMKITGYPPSRFTVEDQWRAIIHPDDLGNYDKISEHVRIGGYDNSEYRIIHASGETRWVQVRIITTLNEQGEISRLDGVVIDVTSAKMMEQALHKSEQRYKSLFEYNSDLMCEFDMEGKLIETNETGRSIADELFSDAEWNQSWYEILDEETIRTGIEHFEKAKRGETQQYELTTRLRSGNTMNWDVKQVPIYVDSEIVGVFSIGRDITQKKVIERALSESEAMYRLIADNMTDMLRIVDIFGRTVYASPSHEKLLGFTPEQYMEEQLFIDTIHPDDLQLAHDEFKEMLMSKSPRSTQFRVKGLSGRLLYVEEYGVPVVGPDGNVRHIVIVSRDITEKIQAEQAIKESEELNRQLVELSPQAIAFHLDYKINYLNPAGAALFGVSDMNEIVGRSIFEYIHPDFWETAEKRLTGVYNQESSPQFVEQMLIRSDGAYINAEVIAAAIPYKGHKAGMTLLRDITDRKKAEEESKRTEEMVRESEDRYFHLQMSLDQFSHDLFGVMKASDMEHRLVKEVQEVFLTGSAGLIEVDYSRNAIVKSGALPDPALEELLTFNLQYLPVCEIIDMTHGCFLKIGEMRGKYYLLCIGELVPELSLTPKKVWLKTITRYVNVLYDSFRLIEDLTSELELIANHQVAPSWLLRFLFNLSENERKRLSQDLHDAALQEQIIWYRKLEQLASDPSVSIALREQLQPITQGLLDVVYQIRITCNELRPPMLKEEGLVSSFEALFELAQMRTNYSIDFDSSEFRHDVNDQQLLGLYRIVQELLANATKHSNATKVHICLSSRADGFQLVYEDNGIGMDLNGMDRSSTSMGVHGMKERVRSLDGKIEFQSSPGNGLAVFITLPVL